MRDTYDGVVEMDPAELLRIYHDFSPEIESGETLTLVEVTATRRTGSVDAAAALVNVSDYLYDDTSAFYGFDGEQAEDAEDYDIEVKAWTTKPSGVSQRLKAKHLIQVRSR